MSETPKTPAAEPVKPPTADDLAAIATAGGVAKFDDGPKAPPMPKALATPPVEKPKVKAKPVKVTRYKVKSACRYVKDGTIVSWPKGLIIDSLNFDIADVRAQGLPIEETDEDIDTTPAIGHRSV